MCERKEAQRAQNAAADALAAVCIGCIDPMSAVLAKVYADVVHEPVPQRLRDLVAGLR